MASAKYKELESKGPSEDDEEKERLKLPPYEGISIWSQVTASWMTQLIWRLYRGKLRPDEIPDESSVDRCIDKAKRLNALWKEELNKKGSEKAFYGWVIGRFAKREAILLFIGYLFGSLLMFLGPTLVFSQVSNCLYKTILVMLMLFILLLASKSVCIKYLLEYSAKQDKQLSTGLLLVLLLFVITTMRIWFTSLAMTTGAIYGPRIRNYTMALIYMKILKIRNTSDSNVGKLVNIAATDGERLQRGVLFSFNIIVAPVLIISGMVFSLVEAGPWALLGFTIFFFQLLVLIFLSALIANCRVKCAELGDNRIKMISELLSSIKIVKIYAWEKAFYDKIIEIREAESKLLFKQRFYESIASYSSSYALIIGQVVTIMALIFSGQDVNSAQAFTLISVLSAMKVAIDGLPMALASIANAAVSLMRIKSVLLLEEFDPPPLITDLSDEQKAIKFSNATFGHKSNAIVIKSQKKSSAKNTKYGSKPNYGAIKSSEMVSLVSGSEQSSDPNCNNDTANQNMVLLPSLMNLNFNIPRGKLIGVCGSIGTGKSSLLQAILGRLKLVSGSFEVRDRMAYVPQEAWIMNTTLKENILFGSQYNPVRYENAIKVCCLEDDLNLLPAGEETEIGDRGINISGGQKQRISLARAVYSDSDIYLLDDPLSAVDSHVGASIFNDCISGALQGKTVIFVTHQVRFLSKCQSIIFLKRNCIMANYRHSNLIEIDEDYRTMVHSVKTENVDEDDAPVKMKAKEGSKISNGNKGDGKLTRDEISEQGTVAKATYLTYIRAMGGFFCFILLILMMIIQVVSTAFPVWWISIWLEDRFNVFNRNMTHFEILNMSINDSWNIYMIVYAITPIIVLFLGYISANIISYVTVYRVANYLQINLLKRVIGGTMTFFDTTPIGQIQNLFSSDTDIVDSILSMALKRVAEYVLLLAISMGTIAYASPWILLPLIPFSVGFFIIIKIANVAVRDLKRLENMARSPQYSLISSTVGGLQTINAYGKSQQFITKFTKLLDNHTIRLILNSNVPRWTGIWLEGLALLIITATGLFVVVVPSDSATGAGLALTYALQLTGILNLIVRFSAEGLSAMTSVERIDYYIRNLDQEPKAMKSDIHPYAEWPDCGQILFYDYSLRYQKHLPLVLDHITFRVDPQQKVGIVGRTGAGKSSLMSALFRLIEPSTGSIYIDGLDVTEIGLEDLRSKLSLIPQDPVLFNNTVRYNVDPFNVISDVGIWEAFERTHLKDKILNLPGQLLFQVAENGSNFSVGERQLICMARALLHSSKILLLDEATASVDPQTDALIQETIRTAFTESTMLIIAHRLNTVLDCDMILVMDKGKIAEYDTPAELLSRPDSLFKSLLQAASL